MRMRVLSVFGTRPEAIKMAPVLRALRAAPGVESRLCLTGQHPGAPEAVLALFGVRADCDLGLFRQGAPIAALAGEMLGRLAALYAAERPDWVLVHGDTTTSLTAALAGFYARVKVGHVEAGLRTGSPDGPWPEEMNRRLVTELASLHFAPTAQAGRNLLADGVATGAVAVTGNTGIDALHAAVRMLEHRTPALPPPQPGRRTVLATQHRRESFGAGLERVAHGLRRLADRGDVEVLFPLHPNPEAQRGARALLDGHRAVRLLPPLDYLAFVALLRRAALVVTDSGGVQEEAPALGKPVLVTRDATERTEAIDAGAAALVGTDPQRLAACADRLLDDPDAYRAMSVPCGAFGDGRAAERIVARLAG
jgi:UDP-N-acetylglucosamine 2-epimerase